MNTVVHASTAVFSVTGEAGSLHAAVAPRHAEPGATPVWGLTIRAPTDTRLAAGTYTVDPNEFEMGMDDPHGAWLDLAPWSSDVGSGSCKLSAGRFVVREYGLDPDGHVQSASISFTESCVDYWDVTWTLHGEFRFNAESGFAWPTYRRPLGPTQSTVGKPADPETIDITSSGTEALTFGKATVTNGASSRFDILSDRCSGSTVAPGDSCAIVVGGTPLQPGDVSQLLELPDNTLFGMVRIALGAYGEWPESAVKWDRSHEIELPARSANESVARSGSIRSGYFHLIYTNGGLRIPGVYHRRSATGSTWSAPVRTNPAAQPGGRGVVAAAGSALYVAWISPDPTRTADDEPTILYVRANAHAGAAGSWGSSKRLTPLDGKVTSASIAASGDSVFVAYTYASSRRATSGAIRVAVSGDMGRTWRTSTLGATGHWWGDAPAIFDGRASVSAAGSLVVVGWGVFRETQASIVARLSTNTGASWQPQVAISSGKDSWTSPRTAATPDQAVVVSSASMRVELRSWTTGGWGPVQTPGDVGTIYAIAASGSSRIGLAAWLGHWWESNDRGATWLDSWSLPSGDIASAMWPTPTVRYVFESEHESANAGPPSAAIVTGRGRP
jgi:hypothetical protein